MPTVSFDHFEIKEHIVRFYFPNNLVGSLNWIASILTPMLRRRPIWLERQFEDSKVLEVVKRMKIINKASGPKGFTMAFLQAHWDVTKGDVMMVFHNFHARDGGPKLAFIQSSSFEEVALALCG